MTEATEQGKYKSKRDRGLLTDFDFGIVFLRYIYIYISFKRNLLCTRHAPRDVGSSEMAARSPVVSQITGPLNFLHNTYTFLPGWRACTLDRSKLG